MLIRCEFRKLFSGRMKWLLLLVFLVNFVLYYLYLIPVTPDERVRELYEQTVKKSSDKIVLQKELELTEERIQAEQEALMKRIEAGVTDFVPDEEDIIISEVDRILQKEYREALGFYKFTEEIAGRSERLLEFSIFSKEGSFSKRNILKTAEDFQGMEEIKVVPQNGIGLVKMQEYFLTDVLLMFVICMLSFQIFGKEGRSGMQRLVSATIYGGKRLRFVQLCVTGSCIIIYALLLYGSNVWQTGNFIGFPELEEEIHGIIEFRNMAFPCTVGKYLSLFLIWKVVATVAITILFQMLIYRLNGTKAVWMILGICSGISFLCWFYLPENPAMKIFRYLNLIGIFDTGEIIGNYQNLNLFTYPVQLSTMALIFAIVLISVCTISIVLLRPMEFRLLQGRNKTPPENCKRNLFFYEGFKNLAKQKTWFIVVLLSVYALYTGVGIVTEEEFLTEKEYWYEQAIKPMIGLSGLELEMKMKDLETQMETGGMETEQVQAVRQVLIQGKTMLEAGGDEGQFVNERVWMNILFDKKTELKNLLIFLLCITFSISGIFQIETKSKIQNLLHSTVKGKRVFFCKLGVVLLESAVYGGLLWGIGYVGLLKKYQDVEGSSFSACSLTIFDGISSDITIGGMVWVVFIQRVLSCMLIGIILFLITQIVVVAVYSIVVSAVIFMFPTVVLMIANMEYINPLVQILKSSIEPFLEYIYLFSSWFSVYREYPLFLYPTVWIAVIGGIWYGYKKWKC